MLRTAMGPTITGWLEDPAIVEIMLNPDGRLWIDRLTGGLSDTGKRLSAERWRAHRASRRPPCRRRGASRIAASFGRTAGDRRTLRRPDPADRRRTGLRHPQASGRDLYSRRLRPRRH